MIGMPTTIPLSPIAQPLRPTENAAAYFPHGGASETVRSNTRLIIKYVRMTNFKSYYGTQELGPFHSTFTSILGPNGSGKSNVIDALLFVFGFRTSKLRQKTLTSLIHKSSQQQPDACRVDVEFRLVDTQSDTDVPGSGFVVSRRVKKTGQSEYSIDGVLSTQKAMQLFLKEKGIDLEHQRFLILQGEVENIAMMKPKATSEAANDGLLEYIEDVIGTSQYKEDIEKGSEELELLTEEKMSKIRRHHVAETERNKMGDDKEKAYRYVRKENECKVLRHQLFQVQLRKYEKALAENQGKMNELEAGLRKLEEERVGTIAEISELQEVHQRAKSDHDSRREQHEALMSQYKQLQDSEIQQTEKCKYATEKLRRTQESLEKTESELKEAQKTLKSTTKQAGKLEKAIDNVRRQRDEAGKALEEARGTLQGRVGEQQKQIETIQLQELGPVESELNKAKADITRLVDELNTIRSDAEGKENIKAQLREDVQRLQISLKEKGEELAKERSGAQRNMELQGKLESVKEAMTRLKSDERTARQEYENQFALFNDYNGRHSVLKALFKGQEEGYCDGLIGRLGSLGQVDEKYQLAMEGAVGRSSDQIVVTTLTAAENCVHFLRERNLGRATFIALDKTPPMQGYPTNKGPVERLPRLVDLLHLDNEDYRKAFFKVMSHTLVAQDMHQARRVAYESPRRYRVVTMKGEILEASGTMTGGAPLRARDAHPGSRIREQDLAQLKAAVENCGQQEQALNSRRHELETQLQEADSNKEQRLALEHSAAETQLAEAQKRLSRSMEASGSLTSPRLNRRIQALEKQLETLESQKALLERQRRPIIEKLSVLEEQVLRRGGAEFRQRQQAFNGLKEDLEDRERQVEALASTAGASERHVERQTRALADQREEVQEQAEALARLEADALDMATKSKGLQGEYENAKAAIKSLERAVQESKRRVKATESRLADLVGREQECAHEIDRVGVLIREDKEKGLGIRKELGRISLTELEDEAIPTVEQLSEEDLDSVNSRQLKERMKALESDLADPPNLSIVNIYRKATEELRLRESEAREIRARCAELEDRVDQLMEQRRSEFLDGFRKVSRSLQHVYQTIARGGDAELEFVDAGDPFGSGINFTVMPPRKAWRKVYNLSGGEKTLSSLALVFALHSFKPTPFYVLDEIDAALDFRNVSIVGDYIREQTRVSAQFIVISLRQPMFQLATSLLGVYKYQDMTRTVLVSTNDVVDQLDEQDENAQVQN